MGQNISVFQDKIYLFYRTKLPNMHGRHTRGLGYYFTWICGTLNKAGSYADNKVKTSLTK